MNDIEIALKEELSYATLLPKAWPNIDFDPSQPGKLPYVAVAIVYASTTDDTLGAEAPIITGVLISTVVTARGISTTIANNHASEIAEAFRMGKRISAGPKTITITQPPHIREGMADGAHWRVPVRIPFEAE